MWSIVDGSVGPVLQKRGKTWALIAATILITLWVVFSLTAVLITAVGYGSGGLLLGVVMWGVLLLTPGFLLRKLVGRTTTRRIAAITSVQPAIGGVVVSLIDGANQPHAIVTDQTTVDRIVAALQAPPSA